MMSKAVLLKQLLLALVLTCAIGTFTAATAIAQVTDQPTSQSVREATGSRQGLSGVSSTADNICKGILSAETGTIPPDTTVASCADTGDDSFAFLVRRIINIFSIVVGAVSVIMIIIGGFRYIISGGDSSGVSNAKNTILYAIVGLVIVLFAQIIIRFILTNAAPGS